MRLGNGTTLRFINTAVTQNRLRVVLSPGLDLLEPCLPGERATFINEGGILLAGACGARGTSGVRDARGAWSRGRQRCALSGEQGGGRHLHLCHCYGLLPGCP